MNKYKKINDMQVLKKYHDIQSFHNLRGVWIDYLSVNDLARELETSKYQIQKAFKSLKEKGYLEIVKYPTVKAECDNGLYSYDVPVLYTNVYMITQKGYDLFMDKKNEVIK